MKLITAVLLASLALTACTSTPDYGRPLPEGWPALIELGPDEARPAFGPQWRDREDILPALERSIAWTRTKHSTRFFPIENIAHDRALASLERMRELLLDSRSEEEFELALASEFSVYKSAGWDGEGGGVLFTGYCTPILAGRLERGGEYQHPLYALPDDLVKGEDGAILGQQTASGVAPYPTRRAIESSSLLADRQLELVWLRDPLDAFIAHVNGSAFIELADGERLGFGYAGKNGREYTSLGKELVRDGQLGANEVSLARIRSWAGEHPDRVAEYLNRNDSFVFFTPLSGNPRGSLNVEVSSGRSLATDKTLFPRGAPVFVSTLLVSAEGREQVYQRFLFDQDTGGAIRTAGRADIYMGIGPEAERLAGQTQAEGQLYYLFLKPELLALRELAQ